MGVLAASAQKSQLIAYRNDIQYKQLMVQQAKISLLNAEDDLINSAKDLDPDSPIVKQIEQRKARLNELEKRLDLELDDYDTRLKLIDESIKACDSQGA